MSSKKKILQNGFSTALQKGVLVLNQLLLVPFFISAWGAAYYGEWITLTIIPSVFAFSDFGFGSAAANSFVLRYSSGKIDEAANIAYTGFRIITIAMICGIFFGVIGLWCVFHFNWLENSLIPESDALMALSFMLLARILFFYMELYEAYFRAARKAALGINLATIYGLMNIGVGVLVLLLGYGVVAFALSHLIVAVLYNFIYIYFAKKTLIFNAGHKRVYVKCEGKEIMQKGLGYLLSPLWQTILFQGTTLVVRLTLGPVAVSVFNTVRTLSRSVNQLYSVVNASIFPEIQFEIGSGNIEKAKKIFSKAIKFTVLLSFIGVFLLAVFGLPAYSIWTNNELNPPYPMWLIFVAATALNAVWWTAAVVFRAMNRPYELSIGGVVSALIAIGITYLGCEYWGLTGAAFGSLVFEFLMVVHVIPKSHKLIYKK